MKTKSLFATPKTPGTVSISGFTFVEVIVAILIGTMALVLATSIVLSTATARTKLDQRVNYNQQTLLTFYALETACRTVQIPYWSTTVAEQSNGEITIPYLNGNKDSSMLIQKDGQESWRVLIGTNISHTLARTAMSFELWPNSQKPRGLAVRLLNSPSGEPLLLRFANTGW